MDSALIRRRFLEFFAARGHREVPSSPLVPADDPTLLFTNAGMVQFKRVFLGQDPRDYRRAVTVQKCVRAGGKHNDLEQVGHTKRHHTFFEMLGNFSFGDYFKREAIAYAWEWVTDPAWLGLHPDRLRVTVHHTDDEARALWREVAGLDDGRIYGLGDKDNFWQMGDTGPCGPCSEIYVDLEWRPGSPPASVGQEEFERLAEEGRFLEIWNLVFMQFDRAADGTLTPLPRPSVDTGAGLERIAAVMQGEDSNFHTDLFLPLIARAAELAGRPYDRGPAGAPLRVLADHARAVAFLLADGVYPANDGRGYVLRRILRRAVRYAWLLGRRAPTLAPLTETVVATMGGAWPELRARAAHIHSVTETEERRFLETIEGGLTRLDELFAAGASEITGDEAFRLYDTFGFPLDLTVLIARERGVAVDQAGFDRALEAQRERSRSARRAARPSAAGAEDAEGFVAESGATQRFVGYESLVAETAPLAWRRDGNRLDLVLEENPFYVESGGQVSDTGTLEGPGWSVAVDEVRKGGRGTVLGGLLVGEFDPGAAVLARVDEPRRRDIERNHSATHLAHLVLRRRLGTHVRQQGSLVEAGRLRFDFSHHGPIDPGQLAEIEHEVNELVWANAPVEVREMAYRDALALGAMAFFADKYGDRVRVVTIGDSIELCGGTHVRSAGQVGLFRVASQGGVAAGVRRLEALTGPGAYAEMRRLDREFTAAADAVKARPEQLRRRLEQLVEERERLQARLADALRSGPASALPEGETLQLDGVTVTVTATSAEDKDEIGALADRFREGRRGAVLVLFSDAGRGAIHAAVTDDLVQAGRRAGDLVGRLAAVSGGKGGGRPHFASAGAGDVTRLPEARQQAPAIVARWLKGES
ncbi:MAG TPA: alanine--tRNA ligase [Gemmatimonadales bacterium]|nr:alanine--tRNA ligase [Gemmatimonadales bacterium]